MLLKEFITICSLQFNQMVCGIPYTGALLGACAYTSTGKNYALIRKMRLIKNAFFNSGMLRTAVKYALNSEYAPISDMRLITLQYSIVFC